MAVERAWSTAKRMMSAGLCLGLAVALWLSPSVPALSAQSVLPGEQAGGRETLLHARVCDLGLTVEGSPRLARAVLRLHAELEAAGISLRPKTYLTDEWGCPDKVPLIGIPFYLADERLAEIQDEAMEGIEGGTEEEMMRYLRHEAGHAFGYAYRLYETREWENIFGPFSAPYRDEYTPDPFSREFVRHLPGWYAQKHPDEDFAETFAVWLTPGSGWRNTYAGWGAERKLLYVDRAAERLGRTGPELTGGQADKPVEELCLSVEEFALRFRPETVALPALFDADLRDIFAPPADTVRMGGATSQGGEAGEAAQAPREQDRVPAARFLAANRRFLVNKVHAWTGLDDTLVRSLVDHLIARSLALDLWVEPARSAETLVEATAYVTALCIHRLTKGEFAGR